MATNIKAALTGCFLLLVGGGLAFYGLSYTMLISALAREGVVAEAKVLGHEQGQYSRRSSHYSLTVEFTPAQGPVVTKTLDVDGSTYRPAVETGRVQMRYLPNDPERCMAGDMAILPFQIIGGLGCVMVLLAPLGWWLTRREAVAREANRHARPEASPELVEK
ncbi:MAG: DUF3592 domain-containing protein [Verrucomicrobiales bacterium]|nr:DUF3592 domain-containing protein [Verrucomicrobiales bacterium]